MKNALNKFIQNLIINEGFYFKFYELTRKKQIEVLAMAIYDYRFDLSEIILGEQDNTLDLILKLIIQDNISELDFGKVYLESMLGHISNIVQEIIDDLSSDMRQDALNDSDYQYDFMRDLQNRVKLAI
jgi:hypothetical protein